MSSFGPHAGWTSLRKPPVANEAITLRPLDETDAPAVARLHIEAIDTGFISSLGPSFVTALYRAIARSPHSLGWVALQGGEVIGFVAFSSHLGRLYRSVLLTGGARLLGAAAGRLLSWQRIKHVTETLMYPQRHPQTSLPQAELLAVAVSSQAQRQGVGRQLVQRGLQQCQEEGITGLKVCVGPHREPANRLYESCGFQFHGELEHHGVMNHIYTIELS